MARLPYVDGSDLPEEYAHLTISQRSREETPEEFYYLLGDEARNVYRAVANAPPLLEAFRQYQSTLWDKAGLDPEHRELVILATARATENEYEWHQHVRVALIEGLSEAKIRAVSDGDLDAFDPKEAALVEYTTTFVDETVDDETHDDLMAFVEEETLVGVQLLSGAYASTAKVIEALKVETEEEFFGWQLENLPSA